ncbi:S-layer homology domain-containing protein [Paenibacillus sp. GCM10027626]|uniref:S-layer homology domain-containing protein n=1 Tax=Paenibacillus sp. GCM10027626 TaxID=3273411 RepID=UPI00362FFC5D
MKRRVLFSTLVMLLIFSIAQSAWAFPDTKGDPNEAKINELKKLGIVAGGKDGSFVPKGELTYAAGIALIVKGLDLTIEEKFIKKPEASDYYTKVKNNVWYSDAFIIAYHNGLDIDKNVDPSSIMTREQFAHHLFKAMIRKGDFAFIELFLNISDGDKITSAYMDSIQKLLIAKIADLDKNNNFKPQEAIKRGVAAGWLHDAIMFVKEHATELPPQPEVPSLPFDDIGLSVKAVNDDVQEVTVSAEVPHPGYGIRIASISFEGDKALIKIEPVLPAQDRMYPQVITKVKATTYISSAYKPVLADQEGSSSSSSTSSSMAEAGSVSSK